MNSGINNAVNNYDAFTPFGWPIVIYLTLAGIACGASLCAVYFLRAKNKAQEGQSSTIVKTAFYVAIGAILAGAILLLFDLQNPGNFYLNFLEFNPASAIAWGTRIITIFVMLCVYSLALLYTVDSDDEDNTKTNPIGMILMALLVFFSLAIGIYPAYVLGQASIARPLWEPLLLMPLFLLLGLHSGFALVQLLTYKKWTQEAVQQVKKLDMGAIILEIILFVLLIVVTSLSSAGKDQLFLGHYALWFWIGVVLIGWVIPLFVNSRFASSSSFPEERSILLTQLCLIGGAFALRTVIVFGGQGAQAFLGS